MMKTIVLRPDPTTPTIVGRDDDGLGWKRLEAFEGTLRCQSCGRQIFYGYISANGRKRRCNGCVEVAR